MLNTTFFAFEVVDSTALTDPAHSHNPKVGGSNPPPATNERHCRNAVVFAFYRGFRRTQSPQTSPSNFPEGRLFGMANAIHAVAFCYDASPVLPVGVAGFSPSRGRTGLPGRGRSDGRCAACAARPFAVCKLSILRADCGRRDILKLGETRWLRYIHSAHCQVRFLHE